MAENISAEQTGKVLQSSPKGQQQRILRIALITLVLLSCVYFVFRGPVRAARRSVDLPVFYAPSRAWLLGSDPYDAKNIEAVFQEAGGGDQRVSLSLNLPLLFPIFAPISALPYQAAKNLWLGINVVLVGVLLYGLIATAGLRITEPRTLFFLAFAVALAPLHTSVSQGQSTIAVAACLVLALRCDIRRRDYLAGILLALAATLKPQMVTVFGFYYLLRLRWRVCLSGIATAAVLAAIAISRLELAHIPWLTSWQENIKALTIGGPGDPAGTSGAQYLMINLQVLLHRFFADRLLVNILTISFVGALGAGLLTAAKKLQTPRNGLLIYSVLALLSLLLAYNLIYCAILLVFPLIWAVASYRSQLKRFALACLILITPFLVPGAAALLEFAKKGFIPKFVVEKWWWGSVIMPHQIYALVFLAICLVCAAVVGSRHRMPLEKYFQEERNQR